MRADKITVTLELDEDGRKLLASLERYDKLLEVARLELGGQLATRELVETVARERDELAARVLALEGGLRVAHERIGCLDPIGSNPDHCSICALLAPPVPPAPPRSPDQIFPAQGSAESCAAKTLDDSGRDRDCRMWRGHKAPHVDGEFSWPVGSWAHRCKLRDDEVIWKHNPETSCDCGEVMP